MSTLVKCPGCELRLPECDLDAQGAHMQSEHPEIIEQRLIAAGFIRDDAGKWIDTLTGED